MTQLDEEIPWNTLVQALSQRILFRTWQLFQPKLGFRSAISARYPPRSLWCDPHWRCKDNLQGWVFSPAMQLSNKKPEPVTSHGNRLVLCFVKVFCAMAWNSTIRWSMSWELIHPATIVKGCRCRFKACWHAWHKSLGVATWFLICPRWNATFWLQINQKLDTDGPWKDLLSDRTSSRLCRWRPQDPQEKESTFWPHEPYNKLYM